MLRVVVVVRVACRRLKVTLLTHMWSAELMKTLWCVIMKCFCNAGLVAISLYDKDLCDNEMVLQRRSCRYFGVSACSQIWEDQLASQLETDLASESNK